MEIHPNSKQAYNLLHAGTLALARAEQQGIRLDLEYCERKKTFLTRKIIHLEEKFRDTKFYRHWVHSIGRKTPNIHSNSQLATFLYRVKKLKPSTTTESGQGSTDEDALKSLDIPELNDLLQIRKLKKIRDTYLDGFVREQVNGYMHPSFNLHLVRTYRSSSDRPNFQNIPKRDKEAMEITRKALFPRPGHQLMEVDYSGIEVSIAACYHKDPNMLKYIKDPNTDMHGDMAKQLFMIRKFDRSVPEYKYLRQAAKNGFVFPQFYGDYFKNCAISLACGWGKLPSGRWEQGQGVKLPDGLTLSDHLIANKIKSLDQFTDHVQKVEMDFWNERFPVYKKWKDKWWNEYQKNGYVDLLTGFRCSGVMSRNDVTNYPVQGAAFHCLLWSFIEVDKISKRENWDTRLVGQIHDAMVLDVHPDERDHVIKTIYQIMCVLLPQLWQWIIVPLEIGVDVGEVDASWAEIKPFDFHK